MELSELLQVTGKVGPIVLGIATIATAVLYLVNLVRRSYRATARARRAEKERDESRKQNEVVERDLTVIAAERDRLREAFEDARRANEHSRQEAAQHQKNAAKFFDAGRKEYLRRRELEASAAVTAETTAKQQQELENKSAALKQATETIETQRKDLERYESQIDAVAKQDGRVWCAQHVTKPPCFVPLARSYRRRPTIVSIMNLKGGVGKTTLTANLGGYLAHHREKWVLLLDLDHQRSLTQTLFTPDQRKDSAAKRRIIQAVLRIEESRPIEEVEEQVQGDGLSRLRIVGNSDAEEGYGDTQSLDDREMDLLGEWLLNPSRCDIRYLLRKALHHSRVIQERYNYVLIDCPPRLTTACINALAASDFVLIPAQGEPVSATSVSHLLRRLRPLRDASILPALRVLVVGNKVSRTDDKKTKEMKLLDQTAAVAAEYWKPIPVRFVKSAIHDSGQYARYQRDFASKRQLQLPAVAIKDIQDEYACLTKELEQIEAELIAETEHQADESLSPSRVSP